MKVKICYKDKNLEIVNIEEYNLNDYCTLLSKRILSILFQVEEVIDGKLNFRELRHHIFDVSGDVARIPENLQDEIQAENIKMKKPPRRLFGLLKREG
jgi:hypothetical protein